MYCSLPPEMCQEMQWECLGAMHFSALAIHFLFWQTPWAQIVGICSLTAPAHQGPEIPKPYCFFFSLKTPLKKKRWKIQLKMFKVRYILAVSKQRFILISSALSYHSTFGKVSQKCLCTTLSFSHPKASLVAHVWMSPTWTIFPSPWSMLV